MQQINIWSLTLLLAIYIQLSLAADDDVQCRTRDGMAGHCKIPRNCRPIANIIQEFEKNGKYTSKQIAVLKSTSKCSTLKVCCKYQVEDEGIRQLLDQDCGKFLNHKVLGGKEIRLMSRPWMALLNIKDLKTGNNGFFYGGTLIHKRYVLTAAHCFTNKKIISIRLGEHQISTASDCLIIRGIYTCAPPVEDVDVEQVFVYEGYSGLYNDVALVKLARDVQFNESIRPICLPINETLQQEASNINSFTVTGWGKTDNVSYSDIPMEVMIARREPSICRLLYNREIKSSQLCVGEKDKDSCNGDSGGPLAYVSYYNERQRFVQHGIVSFGIPGCDKGVPAVYTRVSSFIPWISHIIATK